MKARKVLVVRFPDTLAMTLFQWDNRASGYKVTRDGLTLRVEVQRRTERQAVRWWALCYGAECRTEVR